MWLLSIARFWTLTRFLLVAALAGSTVACGHHRPEGPGSPPDLLEDGWQVSSLEAEGMAPEPLAELERRIEAKEYRAPDALLIARHGKLVYERYWNGFHRDKPHDLRSATKSITSLLVGAALAQQMLPGTDTRVLPLLQRYAPFRNAEERKEHITVRDLLEMRSGLACNDWEPDSPGQEERMYDSRDWVKFILDLPMAEAPGQSTVYCTGGVVVLGALVEDAAGVTFPEFSRRALFEPLGITHFEWQAADGGRTDTGGHLRLRPRDFAKIGQLVLDGGRWQGRQLIPEAWIRESTVSSRTLGDSRYGYLWWVNTFGVGGTPVETFFARGNGGQYAFVFPSLGLTALFTGSFYNEAESALAVELVGRFVLVSALRAEGPKP
ncbi:serine hydrolase [Stigmatella sp. ncwal1]|uniref:Serine hydrolase n=1 Tax=Stigmatella ashevillensis TaxID=2995309 RepID=A0ABT5DFH0_9BACT|nr:serine hydrolase domain-containing protein [Stigmatella ashevillena]MDC0711543.1 serine hydrolase [Stigmatella ashevillena]